MKPRHHPSDATLLARAAGALDACSTTLIDHHVLLCRRCQESLREGETIGGVLLEQGAEAEVPTGTFESVLRRIKEGEVLPQTEPSRWHTVNIERFQLKWAAPGVRVARISATKSATLHLVELQPGASIPRHIHPGTELLMVFKGTVVDRNHTYEAGDVAEADERETHVGYRQEGGGTTPALTLVAESERVKFLNPISALWMRLFGF